MLNYAPRTNRRACGTPHRQQPPSLTASSRAQLSLFLPTRNRSYSQPALESLLNAGLTPPSPQPAPNQGLSLFSLGPFWFYSHIPDDSPNAHMTHGARRGSTTCPVPLGISTWACWPVILLRADRTPSYPSGFKPCSKGPGLPQSHAGPRER